MPNANKARYIVLDIETTGLWPGRGDRIIEIGALAIENGIPTGEYATLIHTEQTITREARKIHGIRKEMLLGQPKPEDVMPEFAEFIADGVLIAHNVKFDTAFLRHEFNRQKLFFNNRAICTLEMSRGCFPDLPNHKLSTVYQHLVEMNGEIVHDRIGHKSCPPEHVERRTCFR